MKSFSSLLILYLLIFFSFITASRVNAIDCNTVSEIPYGDVVTGYPNPADDCSYQIYSNGGHPVYRKWLQYAKVSMVLNPMLSPRIIGNLAKTYTEGSFLDSTGGGAQAESGLQNLFPDIGIDFSTVVEQHDSGSSTLSPNIRNMTNLYDKYNNTIAALGETLDASRQEVMKFYEKEGCWLNGPLGGFANDLCDTSTFRWMSMDQIYKKVWDQHIVDAQCKDGKITDEYPCQAPYNVPGANTTNVEIAQGNIPDNLSDFLHLPTRIISRFIASTQKSKARSIGVCIGITPNITLPKKQGWVYDMINGLMDIDTKYTRIGCYDVQGLVGAIDEVEDEYRVHLPLEVAGKKVSAQVQEIREESKTSGEGGCDIPPLDLENDPNLGMHQPIWDKIVGVCGAARGLPKQPFQFSGGTTKVSQSAEPNWFIELKNVAVDRVISAMEPINPYTLFIVQDGRFTMMEHFGGRNKYAASRAYLSPKDVLVLDDDKKNQINLAVKMDKDEGVSDGMVVGHWPEEEQRRNPDTGLMETVIIQKDLKVKYSGGGTINTDTDGGLQPTSSTLVQSLQMMRALNAPDRIDDCSIYRGLHSKIPNLPSTLNLQGAGNIISMGENCQELFPGITNINQPAEVGVCKQWLFENGNVDKIISAAQKTSCGNGTHINPYYAIAIALNENGGLASSLTNGYSNKHFGCDTENRLPQFSNSIEDKMQCMLNTLQDFCDQGEEAALNNYGYTPGTMRDPMFELLSVLGNSSGLYTSGTDTSLLLYNLNYHLNPTGSDWSWEDYFSNLPQLCKETENLNNPQI